MFENEPKNEPEMTPNQQLVKQCSQQAPKYQFASPKGVPKGSILSTLGAPNDPNSTSLGAKSDPEGSLLRALVPQSVFKRPFGRPRHLSWRFLGFEGARGNFIWCERLLFVFS